ncbi:MAG: hypothetical protein QM535_16670 [Limnohabitans sp.]|nr:hypothetical protein [Limnohabitans sp.]
MRHPYSTNNFEVIEILYASNDFLVAIGRWHTNNTGLDIAMQWRYENNKGYPNSYGNLQWFLVHGCLSESILYGLLSNHLKFKNRDYSIKVLEALMAVKGF